MYVGQDWLMVNVEKLNWKKTEWHHQFGLRVVNEWLVLFSSMVYAYVPPQNSTTIVLWIVVTRHVGLPT